jgi:hypothetical protein
MIPVALSFWFLGILGLLVATYGFKRYRTALNPLTIFVVTQTGVFTLMSGTIEVYMTPMMVHADKDIIQTNLISAVLLSANALPYLFHGSLPSSLYGKGLELMGLDSSKFARRFNPMKFTLITVGAVGAFTGLAVVGGGGIRWLTNTREAYIGYRAGAGPFFALTQWLLVFAFVYYLWSTRPRALRLLVISILFGITAYFLGSKNFVLIFFIIGMIYYHFRVKEIGFLGFGILLTLIFACAVVLLLVQESFLSLMESFLYFKDYFDTTTQFIADFDDFGFQYGRGLLSSLWFYVPRAFYADKPYEYGILLIHEALFPGAAASGSTPGILEWALAYLDFGIIGVFLSGVLNGIWQRMAYEYFLRHKEKFFAFLLGIQFSIWPILAFAPFPLIVLWSSAQSIYLRLTVISRKTNHERFTNLSMEGGSSQTVRT